jgi:type VII secretion protein EccE
MLGAAGGGPMIVLAAGVAAGLLAITWVRVRGRWAFQWLADLLRFAGRRATGLGGRPATEFGGRRATRFASRGATGLGGFGATGLGGLIDDDEPVTLFELHAPPPIESLRLTRLTRLTSPTGQTGPAEVRLQLVLTGVPAPTSRPGPAALSYRDLGADETPLAQFLAILAIRALPGAADPHRARTAAARALRRELREAATGPLDETSGVRLMADLAHLGPLPEPAPLAPAASTGRSPRPGPGGRQWPGPEGRPGSGPEGRLRSGPGSSQRPGPDGRLRPAPEDGLANGLHESWTGVHAGGLSQAVFRCRPRPGAEFSARLLARLLRLPATATTVALTLDPATADPVALLVRLAAPGPAALERAATALHRLLAAERVTAQRCDGDHLPALAATLPRAAATTSFPGRPLAALPGFDHGLLLGHSPRGRAVLVRPFRAAPTGFTLVGSVHCAQLIVFRALGIGAEVLVSTDRPAAWTALRHALTGGEPLTVCPPGFTEFRAGSPLRPILIVRDGSPEPAGPRRWTSTMTVLDQADPHLAESTDLLLLQTLGPDEAALLAPLLDLGANAGMLTSMPPDMLAVVTNRAVRWARLTPTPVEKVLIGPPTRFVALQRSPTK